jgi:hypothetical protein
MDEQFVTDGRRRVAVPGFDICDVCLWDVQIINRRESGSRCSKHHRSRMKRDANLETRGCCLV